MYVCVCASVSVSRGASHFITTFFSFSFFLCDSFSLFTKPSEHIVVIKGPQPALNPLNTSVACVLHQPPSTCGASSFAYAPSSIRDTSRDGSWLICNEVSLLGDLFFYLFFIFAVNFVNNDLMYNRLCCRTI